jgi:RNA polymerase sigma-70 factor (ECF subfamily)
VISLSRRALLHGPPPLSKKWDLASSKYAIRQNHFNAGLPWVVLLSVKQFPRLVSPAPAETQPLGNRDDNTLMTLAQAGSRDAFAVLVERHAVRLVQTCFRFTGDRDQACELAQEIWATIWQRRSRYRSGSEFSIWLITIARNRCRNELRRQRVVTRHASAGSPLGPVPSQGQIDFVLIEERRRRLREALRQLPVVMSDALLLRYGEELRYDEMSTVLGTGESTLRSRVHHALKLLKHLLERSV